ncbi:hypothetical protein GX48_07877, partial [Paracoccidioides brasiliensis]
QLLSLLILSQTQNDHTILPLPLFVTTISTIPTTLAGKLLSPPCLLSLVCLCYLSLALPATNFPPFSHSQHTHSRSNSWSCSPILSYPLPPAVVVLPVKLLLHLVRLTATAAQSVPIARCLLPNCCCDPAAAATPIAIAVSQPPACCLVVAVPSSFSLVSPGLPVSLAGSRVSAIAGPTSTSTIPLPNNLTTYLNNTISLYSLYGSPPST